MGAHESWNVEINILVYENEMFSLTAEFHFNNCFVYSNFKDYIPKIRGTKGQCYHHEKIDPKF